jgi:phospholipid transport system substrate-binding protein
MACALQVIAVMKCFTGGMRRAFRANVGKAAAVVAVMVAAAAGPALAKGESDPLIKLRHTDAEIRAAVNRRVPDWSPEASVRRTRIDQLLRNLLDYQEIARRALGQQYATLTPGQRQEFISAFSALTGQTFLAKMQEQQTRTSYDTETIRGSEAHVSARGACGDAQTEVEYVLERRGDEWLVTDVVIDGMSLVASYQEQFRQVVAREGVDGLLARMRNQLSPSGNYARR